MRSDRGPNVKEGQPGIISAALRGLCPRCGAPTLFAAPAAISAQCAECGLELRAYERGSRWAGVLTLLIAAALVGLALAVDALLAPPLWLQMALWTPITVGGVIFVLRVYKTTLLYARYERRGE